MTYGFSIPFLFVPAVTVGSAGGKGVLPHKICHTARFAHGVVQTAQGGGQVVQPQFLHQHTDAAFGKASLVAAAIRVFVKVHVPRIGVAVGGFQGSGCLHGGNVLCGKFAFSAFAAEPLHQRRHLSVLIVNRQRLCIRPLRHTEDKRPQHGAANDVQLEAVPLFKLRQFGDDLFVFRLGGFGDLLCGGCIIAQHRCQLLLKGAGKHRPHGHGHPRPTHLTLLLSIPLTPGTSVSRCLSGSGGIPSDIFLLPETRTSQIDRSQPAA